MFRTILIIYFLASVSVRAQQKQPTANLDTTAYSELTVGATRYNRTFFLGREFDLRIPNYAPRISYSHRSGLYATVEGFYADKNQPPPHYLFTEAEVGYAGQFTDRWTYSASYDRVFFSQPQLTTVDIPPIRNGLEAYTAYDFGPVRAGLDYTYYFDRQQAHLLTALLGSTVFKRTHWLGLDEVSISPAVDAYWGTANVLQRYGDLYTNQPALIGGTTGTGKRRRSGQTPAMVSTTGTLVTDSHLYSLGAQLAIPLSVTWQKTTFTLTNYTVLTTQLPGQTLAHKLVNYLSFGLSRTFR